MQRRYRLARSPKKQFVNSYHVNEVPLPFYNPLQDPYLEGYFSIDKNAKHLQQIGLKYSRQEQYQYESRRTTNCNKFFRSNSYHVPPVNLVRNREELNQKAKSFLEEKTADYQSTPNKSLKKISNSYIFAQSAVQYPLIGDILSKRPSTTHGTQSERQSSRIRKSRNHSTTKEGKSQIMIF